MDGLLVSNKMHFIGIRSCNNLGQVAIIVPVFILFLNYIHHGLSFLIYFKPNLLLFVTVSLHSRYLHFTSCMFQYCNFNMGFMSLLSFCVSMPFMLEQLITTTTNQSPFFFFFFFLGPVSLCSGCTTAVGLLYSLKHSIQHTFNNPVPLIKRQRSLTEAVLMSFGSTVSFPKTL